MAKNKEAEAAKAVPQATQEQQENLKPEAAAEAA